MNKFNLNCGVNILGTKSFTKEKNGESTTFKITNTGSFNSYKIPPVIVFCEDKVAEELIIKSLLHNNINHGGFNFRRCGSWANIIISLAGCILYSQELQKTGNTKTLEVIGVIDGDISEKDILDMISNTFKGDFIPDELKEIIDQVRHHITSFKLENKVLLQKNIKGKPELNIKNMLEDIDENKINEEIKQNEKKLIKCLKNTNDVKLKIVIEDELDSINHLRNETLEIIEISKKIIFNKRNNIINYHSYFKKLEKKLEGKYFHHYNYTHYPILLVYRIISKFNIHSWESYINPVVSLLKLAQNRQREAFSHNSFNNDALD